MSRLRVVSRSAALALATAVYYVLTIGGRAVLTPRQAARRRWRNSMFRQWSKVITTLMGVEIEVRGSVPESPILLVSNHLSYLDIVVIASRLPAQFVAKSEIRHWPFVGSMCRAVDTLFVDRNARRDVLRVGRDIAARLEQGDSVVLFPEGTSTEGRDVAPFKPSLLAGPAAMGQEVHFATLSYQIPGDDPPAHMAVCWWGDMTFGQHFVELLGVRRCSATVTFGKAPLRHTDRKVLAQRLELAVREQFDPVVLEPPAAAGLEAEAAGSATA